MQPVPFEIVDWVDPENISLGNYWEMVKRFITET